MKSLAHINEDLLQQNWRQVHADLEEEQERLKDPKLCSMAIRMKIGKLEDRIEGMRKTAAKVGIVLTLEESDADEQTDLEA